MKILFFLYRASFAFLGRMKNMIAIFNCWKAELTLGLFLESFQYEVDEFLELCNKFKFGLIYVNICCIL